MCPIEWQSYSSFYITNSRGFRQSETPEETPEEKEKNKIRKECLKEKEKKLDEANFKQHVILIVIAFIGILATSMIQTHSTKLGVGLGGIFTLIIALFMYWHKYNETAKLGVLGVSLALLLFLSVRLYKMNSIVDIFSLSEFGNR